ncbi:MAG: formylmethanofuran dehydrogenase subunit C [Methylophilales bacterium]|nr:formylmethanofuran dehydrogenase subunit C [Methylophilales bacterium]
MSALTFTLKTNPKQSVDMSPITPNLLADKTLTEIQAMLLQCGNQKLRADTLFDITGSDAKDVVIHSSEKLNYLGAKLERGIITIHGNAGAYLGLQMKSGTLNLHGNAAAFAACEMTGGLLHIHGNAGDFLGGALPGDRKGIRGGTVLVTGNAGDRVGDQMRRGMILIEGNAGSYCASRMLAGTIGVMGKTDAYLGFGMRRGTLLLFNSPALSPTIQDCGSHTLPFLKLMFKSMRNLPSKFAQLENNRVRRLAGDIAVDGKGEFLVFGE